jgi:hypothetical protein
MSSWAPIFLAALVLAPAGAEQVICPVTADTYVYATPWNAEKLEETESWNNRGGEPRITVKGREYFGLLQFDFSQARGLTIEKATLRIYRRANTVPLAAMGVSTISGSGPWVEGKADNAAESGAANYYFARTGEQPWSYADSDFSDVTFGLGGSLYAYVEPRDVGDLWYEVGIPLPMVRALISGDQYGLAIGDEKGAAGGRHSFASREQTAMKPVLILEGTPLRDDVAPGEARITGDAPARRLRPGMVLLRFGGAGDDAGQGIATRYELRYSRAPIDESNFSGAAAAPRWQLDPTAAKPHPLATSNALRDEVVAAVEDLEPGATYYFAARASDAAGNLGPVSGLGAFTAYARDWPRLPDAQTPVSQEAPSGVFAFSDLLKINPRTGALLEDDTPNTVWDAANRAVRLTAARNEFVAFQLAIPSSQPLANDRVTVAQPLFRTELFREWFVEENGEWYPDALVPFHLPMTGNSVPGQVVQPIFVDIYVPHDAPPGVHSGKLVVHGDAGSEEIAIDLEVLPFTLPDRLTFQVDLNGYGGVPRPPGIQTGAAAYRSYLHGWHRVAHAHRANLNILGYSHSGNNEPDYAPPLIGQGAETKVASWADWDAHFGPLVSGAAFADLPRAGVPVSALYLNVYEDWPSPMLGNYRWNNYPRAFSTQEYRDILARHALESGPIEEGFPDSYKDRFTAVVRQFAEHFRERAWMETAYQIFFNNKHFYKDPAVGSGRGTSWWLLDEPNYRDDYRALSFFGWLAKRGLGDYPDVPIVFRTDISYIDFMRDLLAGQVDVNCASARFFTRNRYLRDAPERFGRALWNYGSPNFPRESNVAMRAWIWQVWTNGGDGVVPWNTIQAANAWERAEQLTVFYMPRFGAAEPLASMRLKAFRRGQQDAEYLALLAKKEAWDRDAVSHAVAAALDLTPEARQAHELAGGAIRFPNVNDSDFDLLRMRVARALVNE